MSPIYNSAGSSINSVNVRQFLLLYLALKLVKITVCKKLLLANPKYKEA